jgi:predicted PurR-regulated permease PerM
MSETRTDWLRTCGSILLLLVLSVVLWRVRGVVVTVLLALVMAYILRPLVMRLCRFEVRRTGRTYRLPRITVVVIVYLLLGVVLWGIWLLGADSVRRQVLEFQQRWPTYHGDLVRQAARWQDYVQSLPEGVRETVRSWGSGVMQTAGTAAQKGLSTTVRSVWMLVELLLVPILAFYFLADGPAIRQQVLFFVPRRALAWTDHALTRSDEAFQGFIRGQVILCLIAFAVVTLGLRAVGLDFYLLLGAIAGLTRAIPVIGPAVGAVPILIVLLLAHKGLAFVLWFLLLFILLHAMESKLLMPAVLALLIGAQVAGLLGMFLAPPVLAVIRTLLAERREEAAQQV